jgi:CubicO group peptidase (beta-lactamase class C family)
MYAESLTYTNAMGVRSVGAENASKPLELETILTIASCTKMFTTIAVLQCVEDGLVTLDEDVNRLLPDLASFPMISSPSDPTTNQSTLRPKQNPITLRCLNAQTTRALSR